MESKSKSSGSSRVLREKLAEEYVLVPDVLSSVPIVKYFDLLKQTYDQTNFNNSSDLMSRYIDLKKICTLAIDKLPSHNAFQSDANKKYFIKFYILFLFYK